MAALHQSVDFTLCLSLLGTILGNDLGHEIVIALERRGILLGELAPLRADVFENGLLALVSIRRGGRRRIRG